MSTPRKRTASTRSTFRGFSSNEGMSSGFMSLGAILELERQELCDRFERVELRRLVLSTMHADELVNGELDWHQDYEARDAKVLYETLDAQCNELSSQEDDLFSILYQMEEYPEAEV